MKKKLIIAAVGAALAAGMGIAQADVKVSGYGNLSLDMIKGCKTAPVAAVAEHVGVVAGAPAVIAATPASGCVENKNALNVSSNSSYLKFDASEDLGGGLTAVVSIQEFLRIDNNSSGAQVSGGNSYGGLATPGGVIVMGAHDTGAKLNGRAFDLFGGQLGDSRNAAVADNRAPNLLAYLSPNFNGLSFLAAYSTNTSVAAITDLGGALKLASDTSAANNDSVKALSVMVNYTAGPLVIGVGMDKGKLPSDSTADDPSWTNAGVKYTLPSDTAIIGFVQKVKAPTLDADVKVDTMGVGVRQGLGNNAVKAQFYQTKVKDSTGSCKVNMFAVGFDHSFSKTTTGYVGYAQVANKDTTDCTSSMSIAGGGHGDNPGSAAGEKMSGMGAGLAIKF